MIRRVIRTVEKYELLKRGDKVVVALSGGADSVFLLYALNKIKKLYSLELYIAHFNHQLRKKAEEDAEFVKEMAEKQRIQCIIDTRDVREYAKEGKLSLEEGARGLRYEFLAEVASKIGATKIAMGHTMTDEAETLIFRLIRGTGLKGLTLIPPKRDKIIRPLIEIEHNEILDFLKNNGIDYRKDYSNYRTKCTRNFIRYKIMPQIAMRGADFGEKSMRLRDIIEAEEMFLEKITDKKFEELCKPARQMSGGEEKKNVGARCIVSLQDFLKEDLAIKRRIIRKIAEKIGVPPRRDGSGKNITFEETEAILRFIKRNKQSSGVQLNTPTGSIKVIGDKIVFTMGQAMPNMKALPRRGATEKALNRSGQETRPTREIEFQVPGEVQIGEIKLHAQICNSKGIQLNAPTWEMTKDKVYFDFDKLAFPLFIRNRESGDIFRGGGSTSGNGYNKKLKKLFIDDKIPRETRDLIPLLFDQKGILWVVRHRRSSKALVDGRTKRVLEIEAV